MDIDWMPASDEPDMLKKMTVLVGELLNCLPDSRKSINDDTWRWCWEELSDYAQDRVAKVRRKAIVLLAEVEKAQGDKAELYRALGGQMNIDKMSAGRELDALVGEPDQSKCGGTEGMNKTTSLLR